MIFCRNLLIYFDDASRRSAAETFYEALNTILFVFYVFQGIEGNGISVWGHVDRILIDNQPVDAVRRAIAEVDRWFKANPPDHPRVTAGARRWPEVEISGGINLETIRAYAETGPDWISVGALTHSAPALNLSLEIEEVG